MVREVRSKETKKDWQKIDMGSIKNKDVREVGAELPTVRWKIITTWYTTKG